MWWFEAQDTRLGRSIAIKVLPDGFARDPERLARFEREAKMLASLNDPGIAAIYGLEEADGVRFLVLELIPGETLAERLERGPIPLREALALSRQLEGGSPERSKSPTVTSAGTAADVILETAAYMSPEQARGRSLDRRTDVWSFGCLLCESLAGRQAFAGETIWRGAW